MTLADLGNIGEFFGALGVMGSLVYVGYQIRRNTVATERANARVTASEHSKSLQGIQDAEVAEIVLRGLEDLSSLTSVERYRFDLAIFMWIEAIEQAFADYDLGTFPEETMLVYRNRLPSILATPGGKAWWPERKAWFSASFCAKVEELLASPPEAAKDATVLDPGASRHGDPT